MSLAIVHSTGMHVSFRLVGRRARYKVTFLIDKNTEPFLYQSFFSAHDGKGYIETNYANFIKRAGAFENYESFWLPKVRRPKRVLLVASDWMKNVVCAFLKDIGLNKRKIPEHMAFFVIEKHGICFMQTAALVNGQVVKTPIVSASGDGDWWDAIPTNKRAIVKPETLEACFLKVIAS